MDEPERRSQVVMSWATCPKWATRHSAETVEVIERVDGRQSVVMIDVQGSGSDGGRRLAHALMTFCRQIASSGVTSELVVQAAHQHLVAIRGGSVGAAIHVAEVSADHATVTVAGYGPLAAAWTDGPAWRYASVDSALAGHVLAEPATCRTIQLQDSGALVLANDGVASPDRPLSGLLSTVTEDQASARHLLLQSNKTDQGRPRSDKSIVVIRHCRDDDQDRIKSAEHVYPSNGRQLR